VDTSPVQDVVRITRSYELLREAEGLLRKAGEPDIAAGLFLPLGQLEERYDLSSAAEIEAEILSSKASIRAR
jgi:hypothetical protein